MQVQASAKFVRTSPRKVRLVMQGLRGMPVEEARLQLRFTPKPIARDVAKVLDSAVANAENNYGLDARDLHIREIHAGDGRTLRRFRAKARGRVGRILKRTAHITVVVSDGQDAEDG